MTKDEIINKWASATINIECRPHFDKTDEERRILIAKFDRGEIDSATMQQENVRLILSVERYTGTAIYLSYKNKSYLITARHVLEDKSMKGMSLATEIAFAKIFIIQNAGLPDKGFFFTGTKLLNISAGSPESLPFIFSSQEDDLGIIDLDRSDYNGDVKKELENRGYAPIDISDIDMICQLEKGMELTAFGFTSDFSAVGIRPLSVRQFSWESDLLSLPIISEGIVDDPMIGKNFFTGNIFVYHGNSGGPIVSNNKLVGIVSGGDVETKVAGTNGLRYYLRRRVKFIKSSLILSLLKELEKRA